MLFCWHMRIAEHTHVIHRYLRSRKRHRSQKRQRWSVCICWRRNGCLKSGTQKCLQKMALFWMEISNIISTRSRGLWGIRTRIKSGSPREFKSVIRCGKDWQNARRDDNGCFLGALMGKQVKAGSLRVDCPQKTSDGRADRSAFLERFRVGCSGCLGVYDIIYLEVYDESV